MKPVPPVGDQGCPTKNDSKESPSREESRQQFLWLRADAINFDHENQRGFAKLDSISFGSAKEKPERYIMAKTIPPMNCKKAIVVQVEHSLLRANHVVMKGVRMSHRDGMCLLRLSDPATTP